MGGGVPMRLKLFLEEQRRELGTRINEEQRISRIQPRSCFVLRGGRCELHVRPTFLYLYLS